MRKLQTEPSHLFVESRNLWREPGYDELNEVARPTVDTGILMLPDGSAIGRGVRIG